MKRSLGSSDSLGALISICPTTTEEQNHVYTSEFQNMLEGLDEEGCVEELGHMPEKKRRLKVEQVKALEKNFEVENKLEPERKVKLAQELGLQPRQVAVWFQNRRARWKTKQLERDYGVLKANYEQLKQKYDTIKGDNDALIKEIEELKGKLQEVNSEDKIVVKEETTVTEKEKPDASAKCDGTTTELNFESFNGSNGLKDASVFADFKDGSSDSDSSAVSNEDTHNHFLISNGSSSSSSTMNGCFQFSESKTILEEAHKAYQPQFVKIEEHNFFSGEDSCNTFFCDDQAPTLHWYNSNEWN